VTARYRRLSPSERLYLSAAHAFPPFAVQLLIEGSPTPRLADLASAAHRAADANAGARLVVSGGGWLDSGAGPRVVDAATTGLPPLDDPAFAAPFEPATRPPIEILVFRDAAVVFRASHALMDARGLLHFAEDTFRALRGEPPLGTPRVLSDAQVLDGFASPRRRARPRFDRASPLGPGTPGATGFDHAHRRLDGDVSALTARLVAALTRRSPAGSRFMIPASLRDGPASLRTTANLSNPLVYDFPGATDWRAVFERSVAALAAGEHHAREPLDAWAARLPGPLLRAVARLAHRRGVARDRHGFTAVVSHVGTIALASFAGGGFSPRAARMLPFDAPGSALTLVVLQHEHGAEIAASAPAGHARFPAVLDEICEELRPPRRADVRNGAAPDFLALFDAQVAKTPDVVAVSGGARWTYAALDRRSRRWAARLGRAGVARGDRVAVCADRSAEVVAALLGLWRIGAVFVPLDPGWPEARLRFVLGDCDPRALVCDAAAAAAFAPRATLPLADPGDDPLDTAPTREPGDAAYLMYTSGSTGRPKGVVVAHASLANYLRHAGATYVDADGPPVFPVFTSLAFDLTLTSLLVPLVVGGEARLLAERDPLRAARTIVADRELTAIKLTPSHLRLLCELDLSGSSLRTFVIGGEALSPALARTAATQLPRARLFNEYGPTEATVGCIVHRVDVARDIDAVPIGTPIPGATIRLVDGEITIAGDCLATGYRSGGDGRFTVLDGERMYRTGDLASIDADGRFRYHGRADDQVKVRGHRIELGEVTAALAAHPAVAHAAAAARRAGDDVSLVGFVVWRDTPDEASLRRSLLATLPAAAVPARIETVAAMPLTANGKVDREALLGVSGDAPVPPVSAAGATAREEAIREELARLLGIPARAVPLDRSMLELGCDSLRLAILLQRVASAHLPESRREVLFASLPRLLQAPTVRRLADLVSAASPSDSGGRR
jgi:amino acid adenylation domain-containing protein